MPGMTRADFAMTMHDDTGLSRIMADLSGLRAQGVRQVTTKSRTFPCRHARCFISVERFRRGHITHAEEPYIAEMVDMDQRVPSRASVPVGRAHEVPPQPWPEHRPDVCIQKAELRVHAREDGAGAFRGG